MTDEQFTQLVELLTEISQKLDKLKPVTFTTTIPSSNVTIRDAIGRVIKWDPNPTTGPVSPIGDKKESE
jgi:hypothetical protein